KENMKLKKGLFLLLLTASIILLAAVGIVTKFVIRPDRIIGEYEPALSLKTFTLQELLLMDIEVDIETCGKVIESDRLSNVEEGVSLIRSLPMPDPVKFVECSEDVLKYQLLAESLDESSGEELEADQKLLEALGLIDDGDNLGDILTKLLTEQIAGFYDTETKDITIVEGKSAGELLDEVTLAHEVTHALQDQNFNLEKPPLDDEAYNGDNSLAIESLIEGDAMYTMYKYAEEYIDLDQLIEESEESETSSDVLESAPFYLRESLLFPYEQGLDFVKELIARHGEAAVDTALRDPPLSTEQIIHPDKYIVERDNPKEVAVPDLAVTLGDSWEVINSDCMGELDVRLWFEEDLGLLASKEASNGWGGNTIEYYQGKGDDFLLVNAFTWDSEKDASEFFSGYRELLESRFGKDLKKISDTDSAYLYKAESQYFYCGISGNNSLCLQSNDKSCLQKSLKEFPEYQTTE
ncbi:MAG: hypothetical protein JXA49_11165, partial [Actinobacteria bacterium]|nr:hypothetical protein [Actinomycetota bacterium]